jgi:hypothetical protein
MYKFLRTTVCTLSPKIINVEVHYSDVINTRTRPGVTVVDVGSPPTLSAVTTLYDMIYFSQAFAGNSMADKLRSLIQEIDGNNFTNPTILRTTVSDVIVQSSGTYSSTGRIHPRRHRVQCICKKSCSWPLSSLTESL